VPVAKILGLLATSAAQMGVLPRITAAIVEMLGRGGYSRASLTFAPFAIERVGHA